MIVQLKVKIKESEKKNTRPKKEGDRCDIGW